MTSVQSIGGHNPPDITTVKFPLERRAECKLYFQWGGGCDLGVLT